MQHGSIYLRRKSGDVTINRFVGCVMWGWGGGVRAKSGNNRGYNRSNWNIFYIFALWFVKVQIPFLCFGHCVKA